MHQPHRLEPIHARHENVEKQQVEIAGLEQGDALSSVAGGDHAVAGPLQQKADGGLDRCIVIHDQYSCQLSNSPGGSLEPGQRQVVGFAETPLYCNGLAGASVSSKL